MDNAGLLSKVVEAVAAAQCGSEKGQVRTGKWGTDPRGGTDLEGGHRPRAEATDSGGGHPHLRELACAICLSRLGYFMGPTGGPHCPGSQDLWLL